MTHCSSTGPDYATASVGGQGGTVCIDASTLSPATAREYHLDASGNKHRHTIAASQVKNIRANIESSDTVPAAATQPSSLPLQFINQTQLQHSSGSKLRSVVRSHARRNVDFKRKQLRATLNTRSPRPLKLKPSISNGNLDPDSGSQESGLVRTIPCRHVVHPVAFVSHGDAPRGLAYQSLNPAVKVKGGMYTIVDRNIHNPYNCHLNQLTNWSKQNFQLFSRLHTSIPIFVLSITSSVMAYWVVLGLESVQSGILKRLLNPASEQRRFHFLTIAQTDLTYEIMILDTAVMMLCRLQVLPRVSCKAHGNMIHSIALVTWTALELHFYSHTVGFLQRQNHCWLRDAVLTSS